MRSATISVRFVVDDHIQADIGRGREETWQDRHDDGRDRMLGCSDADSTGRLAAKGADGVHAGSDVFQCWAQRPQQRLARFCRRHRARGPRQEPHPEPLLQSLHGVAQCRLRHAEFGSRAGKAALLRDGGEGGEVLQVVSSSFMTACISPSELYALIEIRSQSYLVVSDPERIDRAAAVAASRMRARRHERNSNVAQELT